MGFVTCQPARRDAGCRDVAGHGGARVSWGIMGRRQGSILLHWGCPFSSSQGDVKEGRKELGAKWATTRDGGIGEHLLMSLAGAELQPHSLRSEQAVGESSAFSARAEQPSQLLPCAMSSPLPPPPQHGGAVRWVALAPQLPSPIWEQTSSVSTHRGAFSGAGPRPPSSSSPGTPGPSIAGLCRAGAGAGSGGTGHVTPVSSESPCQLCPAQEAWNGHRCPPSSLTGYDARPCALQTWTSCSRTCGPSCSSWTGKASAPLLGPRRSRWPTSCPGCRAPRVSVGLWVGGQGAGQLGRGAGL